MKKNILLLTSLFFCLIVSSQTLKERNEIIKNYDQESISALKTKLEKKNSDRKKRIEDYLKSNPIDAIIDIKGVGIKKLYDVIDNKPIYISTENIAAAASTRTDFIQPGGSLNLNLEGENMHVATWDGGPTLSTHQEFEGYGDNPVSRVTTPDASASNSQSNHSTHVSGTIVAKGVNASAKGMAPRATLTSFDWDNDDLEALQQATTNGLLLSNHSYGIPITQGTGQAPTWLMGAYDTDASTWDDVHYNAPYYLMVASAGNDGSVTYTGGLANNYDKLTTNKNSKNNLVVANATDPLLHPNGSGDLLNLFINTSSSQGPSDDGRIKPDISADGTNLFSPISSTDLAYATFSGTSMAAPNTTGTLLLLQEYYNQLNGSYMKSASLKGLVCHTATDDFSSPGPDPIFGWGMLDARKAAEAILAKSNGEALIIENNLADGAVFTTTFNVTDPANLSATLCWTDVPGIPVNGVLNSSVPALVNDLDIRITDPTGAEFFPWKLQLSNVQGVAIKGDNLVDNVENIDVTSTATGTYTLTVSHKGNITNSNQDYSLIITGTNLTLSVPEETIEDGFNVWPNPTTDVINYKLKVSNESTNVSLIDIQGRLIYSKEIKEQTNGYLNDSIDTESFSKGVYFLRIEQGRSIITKKVVLK